MQQVVPNPHKGKVVPYDDKLTYHNRRQLLLSALDAQNNELPVHQLENVPHFPTVVELARFAELVYLNFDEQENRLKDGMWTLLAAAENKKISNGYCGSAYYHAKHKHLVIAHRGTDCSTVMKIVQNIVVTDFAGIVLNKDVPQIRSAITFTHTILNIVRDNLNDNLVEVFITGHSLGAWLAQITTYTLKHFRLDEHQFINELLDADKNHVNTIVFDSPGCKNALFSLHGMRYAKVESHIGTLNITTYISQPSEINSVNEHVGTIYEISKELDVHAIKSIIEILERIKCRSEMQRVAQWPIYRLFGNELQAITQNRDDGTSPYYKTVPFDKNECSVNVFTKTERAFLFAYKVLLEFPILIPKAFPLPHHADIIDVMQRQFSQYEIDTDVFKMFSEEQLLENFIPFLRRVGKLYPDIFTNAIDAINTNEIKKSFYQHQSSIFISTYIDSIRLEIDSGMENIALFDRNVCHILPTADVRIKITQIYHKLQSLDVDKYKNSEFLTILDLQLLLFNHETINIKDYLLTLRNHLLIIECKRTDSLDFDPLIQKLLTDMKVVLDGEDNLIKIVFVTHADDMVMEKKLTDENLIFSKLEVNDAVVWQELNEATKTKILNMNVNFQGENISLKQLTESNHDIILDSKSLMCLIDNYRTNSEKCLTICMNVKLFNNFETRCCKIYDEFPKKNLLKLFDSPDNLFFISGCSHVNDFMLGFDSSQQSQIKTDLLSFSNSENPNEEFKKFCNENLYKTIYWLDKPTSETILCQRVYCRDFYVKREFDCKILLKQTITQELCKKGLNEKFVFLNVKQEKTLVNLFPFANKNDKVTFSKHIKDNMITNWIEFNKENNGNDNFPVHFIEYDNESKQLIWIRSTGSLQMIRKHMTRNTQSEEPVLSFKEEDFYKFNEKVVIIVDEPGMGKTTTVTSLSTQLESSWTMRLNLKNCSKAIASLHNCNLDVDKVVQFFTHADPSALGNPLTISLFKFMLVEKLIARRVYIFLDGFDEIKEEEVNEFAKKKEISGKQIVLRLIKFLETETTAYVVVTSREHTRSLLEKHLSKYSLHFKKIDDDNQILFFLLFWKKWLPLRLQKYETDEIEKTRAYTKNLLLVASKMFGSEISNFIGVPLQLRMLTELCVPKERAFQSSMHNQNNYDFRNIAEFFDKYLERKTDIYLMEKYQIKLNESLKHFMSKQIETYHRYFAIELIFPHQLMVHQVDQGFQSSRETRLKDMYRIGIIKFAPGDSQYEFSHRTFAECNIAALCFDQIYPNKFKDPTRNSFKPHPDFKRFLKREILVKPEYRIIRLFLDCHLSNISNQTETMRAIRKAYGCQSLKYEHNLPPPLNVFQDENLPHLITAFCEKSDVTFPAVPALPMVNTTEVGPSNLSSVRSKQKEERKKRSRK